MCGNGMHGTHQPSSVIPAVQVGPRQVQRDRHFFGDAPYSLETILKVLGCFLSRILFGSLGSDSRELEYTHRFENCLLAMPTYITPFVMMQRTPGVTSVQPVPDAYVPIMAIEFNGFEIDLLYASLALNTVPEALDISSTSVLRGCDEQSIRSLNGCRVTDRILR